MTEKAFISGCAGHALSAAERAFFAQAQPWGLILFGRNIDCPDQVCALTRSFRECVGRDAPVLIDQEGGRVARLRAPHWPPFPPAGRFGELYQSDAAAARDATQLGAQLIGLELSALGIDVDCLPVLDLHLPQTHSAIGDRAYGQDAGMVADLGRSACRGLLCAGVLPVIKHVPGHGRALVDSHQQLPVVDASLETLRQTDFEPFRQLADMPLAMSAHVVYSGLDQARPATQSKAIITEVIRREIGFHGVLMTDDISMGALSGTVAERSVAAWQAGCDLVLHCNGKLEEMQALAEVAPAIDGATAQRCQAALSLRTAPQRLDVGEARARFAGLMERVLSA